jgi:hypothetical protein
MPREHSETLPLQNDESELSNESSSGERLEFEQEAIELMRTAQRLGYELISRPDTFGEPAIYSPDGAYLANRVRGETKRPKIAFISLGDPEAKEILIDQLRQGTSSEQLFRKQK